MLVLVRKVDEELVMNGACANDKIVIKILNIREGAVRLGIGAPTNVIIMRRELIDD